MTEVYEIINHDFDTDKLAQQLHHTFIVKEKNEIARIHAILDLFESTTCITQRLAQYFNDDSVSQRCGHCSVCEGHTTILDKPAHLTPLTQSEMQQLCQPILQNSGET